MDTARLEPSYEAVKKRVRNFSEFIKPLPNKDLRAQAGRCMDCGVPYCQTGCPVHNQIPDWNDLVYHDDWRRALDNLHSTNNFPEFTGRICPAPCEAACTLNIRDIPVTIKAVECAIVDKGWKQGWIKPQVSDKKTGKKIAIIGSGPAGLACAQQLVRAGHTVGVFEKNSKIGGLLRYGIPDFKMEKHHIDLRVQQMQQEGVKFFPNHHVDARHVKSLLKEYHALVLACGSETPRDLPIPGRNLNGVHFAMDFLTQQNRRVGGEEIQGAPLSARGKHVVVIGGGDTGSDCVGTSIRQKARSVTQLEIMPLPPEHENKNEFWPNWPLKLRTSSSQAEGSLRHFSMQTERFLAEKSTGGKNTKSNNVQGIACLKLTASFKPVPRSQFELPADLVLLAMGFTNPTHFGLLDALGREGMAYDARGNVKANDVDYATSLTRVFATGDARRGQSLVVWAIREGRQCARAVDAYLMGNSDLPQ